MKKKLLGIILFLSLFILPFSYVLAEKEDTSNDNLEVVETNDKSDYIDHSIFEAGNEISVDKKVDGISFIAGNIIKYKGISTYGALAGENVVISNSIEKDLFAAGNIINIEKEAKLGRDIYLAGSDITIASDVNGKAYIAGSTINLEDITILGDVNIAATQLNIKGNVKILGTLNINEDAKISNESNLEVKNKQTYKINTGDKAKSIVTDIILNVLTLVFTGILLSVLIPRLFTSLDSEFEVGNVLKKSAFGFVALIAVPIASLVLMGTVVGLRLGFIVLLAYVIMLLLAMVLSSYVFGKFVYTNLFKQNDNLYLDIIIGILLVKLISYIPYIGGLIYFIALLYGIGLILGLFKNKK